MNVKGNPENVTGETISTLRNARVQALQRGYDRFPIFDSDAHHYENESFAELEQYFDDDVVGQMWSAFLKKGGASRGSTIMPTQVGNQDVSGRILRYGSIGSKGRDPGSEGYGQHPDFVKTTTAMDMMGIDAGILFPTPMLNLGLHPQVHVEVAISMAYARWITERVLPENGRIKTMLYLPFGDADACVEIVERFGGHANVIGFMVTSGRYRPVHDNVYATLYRMLEERALPICFHALYNWSDQSLAQLNRFISVHALGFPFYNMIHLTNMIINGIPERFPGLKVIWMESGVSWIPFLMERLDSEYMMRTSEAPLLKERPSEYMRRFFYTSQPMERGDLEFLEATFKRIDAARTLLYASDYPHWDFDLPSVIYDLPFLDENEKRRILGRNAIELFGLSEFSTEDVEESRQASKAERLEALG